MRPSILIAALATCATLPVQAQPVAPPARRVPVPAKAPLINAEARSVVEAMIANYKALKSYSDKTAIKMEGTGLPRELLSQFPLEATLAWQRPDNFRFEGKLGQKEFLALSSERALRAINPSHPGLWLEQNKGTQFTTVMIDGKETQIPAVETVQRLDAAVYESGAMSFGVAFMTEANQFWGHTFKDATVMALEPDAEIEGIPCRVVNVQTEGDKGDNSLIRLWIGRDDKMIRRIELTNSGMGVSAKLVETHSDVHADPDLPASTWEFTVPAGLKKVATFPVDYNPKDNLTVKVGGTLPTFSGDDINDKPIELNPKDGKVTLLYFFQISNGGTDVDALQRLHAALSDKGLHVIGVSGDGRRERVEKFVAEHKLTFPIYFDEGAMHNRVANLFGVRGWSTTLIFNREGKLDVPDSSPGSYEFLQTLSKLFPGAKTDALIFGNDDVHPLPPAP